MVNDLVNTPFAPLTDLGRISSGVHMHNLASFCLPSPPPHNDFPLQFPGGSCWSDLLVIKISRSDS